MRRALARTSSTESPGLSSMKIGASERRPAAEVSRCQSCACKRPVRTASESTRPSEDSMRCTSCWDDISRLSTSTFMCSLIPTCWAIDSAKAVLWVTT